MMSHVHHSKRGNIIYDWDVMGVNGRGRDGRGGDERTGGKWGEFDRWTEKQMNG